MKPGIYADLTNEAYHSGPGVNKSTLWTLHTKTPGHVFGGVKKVQTKAMAEGTICHVAVLEPESFEDRYVRGISVDKRTKDGKAAWEAFQAENANREVVDADTYDMACAMRDSLHASSRIRSMTQGGVAEQSAYWTDDKTGLLCRVRPDLVVPGAIIDLKTTTDAGPQAFASSVAKFGYHLQASMYLEGWASAGGDETCVFQFIAVEKEPPYAFAVYMLDMNAMTEGEAIFRNALDTYKKCQDQKSWPSYPNTVERLSLPNWAYRLTQPRNLIGGIDVGN